MSAKRRLGTAQQNEQSVKQMGSFSSRVPYSWQEGTRPIHSTCTDMRVSGMPSATMTGKAGEGTWLRQASLRGGLTTPRCVPRSSKCHQEQQASQHSPGHGAKPWHPSSSWCFPPAGGALSSQSGQRVSGSQGAEGSQREELKVPGESGELLYSDLGGRRGQ